MILTGLHLLLTYQCTLECDHCFVWGSPRQAGVMSSADIREFVRQAAELGSIRTICFEGGEPFLYPDVLLEGVREVVCHGFRSGIVTNAFWASSPQAALHALEPYAGLLDSLTVSSDLFHWSRPLSQQAQNAQQAAAALAIPCSRISIARPEPRPEYAQQLPYADGQVMYRGRAVRLASFAPRANWQEFTRCPHENLREPGRVHLDPSGYVHICQGITLGNLFEQSLTTLAAQYDPQAHPITGPLLRAGPAGLVREYSLPHQEAYADACQLCYEARRLLRSRFPGQLAPDAMYGEY